ncbi:MULTISPECIES: hypothetical protein [unclassified Stenotrophomonas maltophilia group]|nr:MULTISPECIES: hypothetical protein [unclassified Stenotrophomonas maltophilia group]
MDASHPLYLAAEREISHAGTRQRQRLHIPHEAVAFVIEGPMGQGRQLGFRAISS